ncbi:MAG: lactate racemase domain-containing protein [Negativicutes bacterium]
MDSFKLPKVVKVRQNFLTPTLKDVPETVRTELAKINFGKIVNKGDRIAITVGSRGIANMLTIIKTIVSEIKSIGAEPFIVPAMGSHGGATAAGQVEMLESLGITEKSIDASIVSSMEVVQIGTTSCGIPVFIDKQAANADGIIVVNRVKPHTEFEAEIESGLMKMMVIGLGKHKGAETAHRHIINKRYSHVIPAVAREVMKNANILCGVATVENVYHETAIIKAMLTESMEEEEKQLLAESKKLMAHIPFDELDVLVVSELGKQISGAGMDPNVIGRIYSQREPDPITPVITNIVALDLTPETHGNAMGIGLADFVTKRMVDQTDFNATYINAITGLAVRKAFTPIVCTNDFDAISKALITSGSLEAQNATLVWIKNTQELAEIYVSEALLPQVAKTPSLEIISETMDLPFDENNNLVKWDNLFFNNR